LINTYIDLVSKKQTQCFAKDIFLIVMKDILTEDQNHRYENVRSILLTNIINTIIMYLA